SAKNRPGADAHKEYFASAHPCHYRPLEQVVWPPRQQPVGVRQQSCSRNNKHTRSIEGLESLKPPVKLTRHANQNPSQQSDQSAAALFALNESAPNWNSLDLLSCCQSIRSRADASHLGLRQNASNMVKHCLKSDLVAEVGRAKVPKKANFLSLPIEIFHRVLLSVRYVNLKATSVM